MRQHDGDRQGLPGPRPAGRSDEGDSRSVVPIGPTMSPRDVVRLQRLVGNAATVELMNSARTLDRDRPTVQRGFLKDMLGKAVRKRRGPTTEAMVVGPGGWWTPAEQKRVAKPEYLDSEDQMRLMIKWAVAVGDDEAEAVLDRMLEIDKTLMELGGKYDIKVHGPLAREGKQLRDGPFHAVLARFSAWVRSWREGMIQPTAGPPQVASSNSNSNSAAPSGPASTSSPDTDHYN